MKKKRKGYFHLEFDHSINAEIPACDLIPMLYIQEINIKIFKGTFPSKRNEKKLDNLKKYIKRNFR